MRSTVALLSVACHGGGTLSLGPHPSVPTDTGEPATSPTADTADTEDTEDTHDTDVTDTIGGDTATYPPPDPIDIAFEPPPGSFVGDVTVAVTASEPEATVLWSVGSNELPSFQPATGPVTLDRTTTVYAYVAHDGFIGEVHTAVYVEIDPALSSFTSDIPILVLHSEFPAPTYILSERTPFTLSVFEPDPDRASLLGPATVTSRAGLRVRGSSSAGHPKHPYSLELWQALADDDRDVPLLGMPADGDWVMYAPINFDRALIRNAFAYELSNDVGQYASRTRFAEVFVAGNGQVVGNAHYLGVYDMIEEIERHPDRLDLAELDPAYDAEPEISGGYIFKRDRTGSGEVGFTAGTAGGAFTFAQRLVYTYPKEEDITPVQAAWLTTYIDDFAWALAAPDHLHPVTGAHYDTFIDWQSWIDHHAVNVMTKNPDALRLSGYLYKDREGPLVAGPVWDFDRTMGCSSDSRCDNPTWWDASNQTWDTTFVFEHGWYLGLFDDPVFRDAYFARWEELLAAEFSVAAMHGIIDRMAAELDEAAVRNFAAWPSYPPRGGSFESEIAIMTDWLADRHAWISACLADPAFPDKRDCRGT